MGLFRHECYRIIFLRRRTKIRFLINVTMLDVNATQSESNKLKVFRSRVALNYAKKMTNSSSRKFIVEFAEILIILVLRSDLGSLQSSGGDNYFHELSVPAGEHISFVQSLPTHVQLCCRDVHQKYVLST
jgi:hypothetical protein